MAERVAGSLRDAPLLWDVEQVRAAVARSTRRGRVAIVIADNRKRSPSRWFPPGTWLARPSLKEQLYLVYTPAYDPDAKRTKMSLSHTLWLHDQLGRSEAGRQACGSASRVRGGCPGRAGRAFAKGEELLSVLLGWPAGMW